MPDIQHLIELLKSGNPNKRYDACEQLRVSSLPLTEEAIDALRSATNDTDSDVADAAQRALALHAPPLTPDVFPEKKQEQPSESLMNECGSVAKRIANILWIGLAIVLLLVLWGLWKSSHVPTPDDDAWTTILPTISPENASIPKTLSQSPLPFSYMADFQKDEFLFVYLEDTDPHCLDGLCECPLPEWAIIPLIEFEDGMLTLDPFNFHKKPNPDDWINLQENTKSIALYGVHIEIPVINQLQLYSSFPVDIEVAEQEAKIIGVNSQGDIQIKTNDGYAIILVGSDLVIEQPESIDTRCKILHNYTLHNYGFIKDQNVAFEDFGIKYGP